MKKIINYIKEKKYVFKNVANKTINAYEKKRERKVCIEHFVFLRKYCIFLFCISICFLSFLYNIKT